jgi:phosphoribosylanthranilate isomerase
MVKVKFCGIKRDEDALDAARLGVHALGFIFLKESPRYISPQQAKEIILQLPPLVLRIGVFRNQTVSEIMEIASFCKLDAVQLHGEESPAECRKLKESLRLIKTLRVKDQKVLELIPEYKFVDAILLDTYQEEKAGGTGQTFNWEIAREARKFKVPIILSGGLTPDNIKQAIREVNPYAVDVSSGIEEKPGMKSHELMAKFIASVWEEEWGI